MAEPLRRALTDQLEDAEETLRLLPDALPERMALEDAIREMRLAVGRLVVGGDRSALALTQANRELERGQALLAAARQRILQTAGSAYPQPCAGEGPHAGGRTFLMLDGRYLCAACLRRESGVV